MRTTRRGAVFALIAAGMGARNAGALDPQGASPPPVTIASTELRSLHSVATGRDYDIYVYKPSDYESSPSRSYPVLYLLDGQWDFKLLTSIQGGLLYDKFVPEIFVVGITYSGPKPDYDALRAADYTPVPRASNPGSGGAARFLGFLKGELMPYIDGSYRTEPGRRAIMGSSLGGLFSLYAMFSDPGLFEGVVAASPAVTYGDRVAFSEEAAYAAARRDLSTRLFIAVGGQEELTEPVIEFGQIVRARNYRGLTLETRVIEGERHSGNKPETFNRGLRFIFGNR
jgi:hypothetical protein